MGNAISNPGRREVGGRSTMMSFKLSKLWLQAPRPMLESPAAAEKRISNLCLKRKFDTSGAHKARDVVILGPGYTTNLTTHRHHTMDPAWSD